MKAKIIISGNLRDFLRKKRVLKAFIHNALNYRTNRILPITRISEAFSWSDTEQGAQFWSELSSEFNSI